MLAKTLKSRTVWTVVVMIIINGIPSVRDMLPATALHWVDVILPLAAGYFRIAPVQNFQE